MTRLRRRFDFIDSVRGLAVVLAMLSHCFLQFTAGFEALIPLTRTATPAFIVLFGIMIEVAYLSKLRGGRNVDTVEIRLISRMLTCYLFFVAITIAAFATGKLGKMATLKALVFVDEGFLGVILKIYTVLFLLVLLLLPLLQKHGARLMLVAAILGWCLKYLLDAVLPEAPHLVTFVFGTGKGFAPSILPSMTFLAFGMAFGEYLTGKSSARTALVLLLIAVVLSVLFSLQAGSVAGVRDAWLESRWINDPFYYAMGICSTATFLGLFWLSWQGQQVPAISRFMATMGCQTLFIYGAGNVVLALLPPYSGASAGVATACVVVFMLVLLAVAWVRSDRSLWLDRALLGLPKWYAEHYEALIQWSSSTLLRVYQAARRAITPSG